MLNARFFDGWLSVVVTILRARTSASSSRAAVAALSLVVSVHGCHATREEFAEEESVQEQALRQEMAGHKSVILFTLRAGKDVRALPQN